VPQAGSRSDAGSVARAASAEREAQSEESHWIPPADTIPGQAQVQGNDGWICRNSLDSRVHGNDGRLCGFVLDGGREREGAVRIAREVDGGQYGVFGDRAVDVRE
jgi:hypothetical protein